MKKKNIVIGIIIFIGIIGIFVLATNNKKNENAISRYEWIKMLTDRFGIIEYTNEEPYYEDVSADNEYYKYVQSAFEYKLLDEEQEKFNGEEPATGDFVALTSMRAIGKYKIQIYLEKLEEPADKEYLKLAVKEELIKRNQRKKFITKEESEIILSKTMELYQYLLWKDDVSEITYQPDVIQIASNSVSRINKECSQIELNENNKELEIGKILIIEHPKTKEKIAKKIKEIANKNICTLEDVELVEVIDFVEISDITPISTEDVITYYEELSLSGKAEKKEKEYDNCEMIPVGYHKWESMDIAVQLEMDNGEIKASVINDGWTYSRTLKELKKHKDVVDVTINIRDLCVGTQMIASLKNGVEYFNVQTQANINVQGQLSIEGTVGERIPFFETNILLAGGTISTKLEFYLILSADGTVGVEASIPTSYAIEYSKEYGRRSPGLNISMEEPKLIADCTTELFVRSEAIPKFLGISIVDVEGDFGLKASGTAITRNSKEIQLCVDLSLIAPFITISVSGDDSKSTLINGLNLSGEWELVNENNAWFKDDCHAEMYKENTWTMVDECTWGNGNVLELLQLGTILPFPAIIKSIEYEDDYYEIVVDFGAINYIPVEIMSVMNAGDTYSIYGNTFLYEGKNTNSEYFVNNSTNFDLFSDKNGEKYYMKELASFSAPDTVPRFYEVYGSESGEKKKQCYLITKLEIENEFEPYSYSLIEKIRLKINDNAIIYEITEITSQEKYGDSIVTSVKRQESEAYTFEDYFESYINDTSEKKKDINIPINLYLGANGEIWCIKVVNNVYEDEWLKP